MIDPNSALARIAPQAMPQEQQPAQPAPTYAQTMAAVHRFTAVQHAMKTVIEDPQFGKANVRPKLLNVASKLLGNKIVSLTDIMNTIKDMPDDPLKQKGFVEKIFNDAGQARLSVLRHHQTAKIEGEPDQWDTNSHGGHMDSLMGHYRKK